MALPTIAAINAAVDNLYAAFSNDKLRRNGRLSVSLVGKLASFVPAMYEPAVTLAITNEADAGVAEAIAVDGEIGIAYGKAAPVGIVFQTTGTGDLTDDALATAKGGALAAGDLFQVTGADAVTYLGSLAGFDFADENVAAFVSLGE